MENNETTKLHAVETNWEEIEEKIRQHRKRRTRITLIALIIVAALIVAYFITVKVKVYTDFAITDEVGRGDSSATHYMEYREGFIKYSNDGISYTNVQNQVIWNQGYEMQNPIVVMSGEFVAVADLGGEEIFVMDSTGLQGDIRVNMPIGKLDIASQGTVAVLTQDNATSYLGVYDKLGTQVAEGAIHAENGGAPTDIALSADAKKLGVSILDVSQGAAKTTLTFYNFGATGQNQVDNIVATFEYEDTVMPVIQYVNDSTMLGFSDKGVYTYSGSTTPAEASFKEVTDAEIQSIFYNQESYGLVFINDGEETGRMIKLFDLNGNEKCSFTTDAPYDQISFMDNGEVCLLSEHSCAIYKSNGKEKFHYTGEQRLSGLFHDFGTRYYTLLEEGKTENIRLKIFDFSNGKDS